MENQPKNVNQPETESQTVESDQSLPIGPIKVEANEIGIVNGTKIELDSAFTELKFEKEGDHVVMNLRVTFKPQPDNIIVSERTIDAEWLAAFDLTDPNKNFCDNSEFKKLVLLTKANGIIIGTENSDFKLFTNAGKKLSGQALK